MAFRHQTATRASLIALFFLHSLSLAADLRVTVRLKRVGRDQLGQLLVHDQGLSFQPSERKQSSKSRNRRGANLRSDWPYSEIQQLWVSADKLVLLTYKDRKWRLGSDQGYTFFATADRAGGPDFRLVYEKLKNRSTPRLVVALADPPSRPLWSSRVKLQGLLEGSEGELMMGEDRIVYQTDRQHQARTWRFEDLENVFQSDRYHLTLVSWERAWLQYESRRAFNFQLKEPLEESRFQTLWRKVQVVHGLEMFRFDAAGQVSPAAR
ncbi:MAG: hypothetical protein NZV14_00415 [Bryobacteraceae bacterium]|nr:hypothetical protein [Bryobacteraceae bacterium]MDW8376595.1 hypothetical protein [Bryobacterales bacterium]